MAEGTTQPVLTVASPATMVPAPPAGDRPFTAIAAMAQNRVIGMGNRLPWHLPEDFRWFRQTTLGHVLVMGRRTFESIGRPLPGRDTIVLSRQAVGWPGVRVARGWDEVLAWTVGRRVFICGGAEVYRQALAMCSDLYLTLVLRDVPGDAFFPPFEDQFELVGEILATEAFRILHYRARPAGPARAGSLPSAGEHAS
ncbi:dihydrofolate reductase [Limisphaera sp. VF-2]|jgi:dihydrofolate reductase|uniref:dihydrofolate reductase n=1 Tax=Limisphaera sp. VF-2 TaxID=3400418 RepID=UPI003C2D8296